MADAPTNEPRLSGSVPLYRNVEPLNRQRHANYGVSTSQRPFDFLNEWHFVPAIVGEFAIASGSYPLVFLGERKMPVAVMGLTKGRNLFVTEEGQFDPDHYVPAYIRRYPFVSATSGDDQPATVCIDTAADFVVSENAERPFFDASGEPTEYTQQAIDFVTAFEGDVRRTEAFVERLNALDLFEKKDVRVSQPDGNETVVAEYFGVSGEKYSNLSGAQLEELRASGDLAAIVAHFISLQRWERILRRAAQAAPANNVAPAANPAAN